jgi:hypothetical protein
MSSPESLQSTIGNRLKQERKRLQMTQKQAAAASQTFAEHWGRCERGVAQVGTPILSRFGAHGADVHFILTGNRAYALSPEEQTLLLRYRASTPEMRSAATNRLYAIDHQVA